jgi:hypothetical protein
MVAALREAARVARPSAPVVIQVWGRPERCHLEAMKHALGAFLPPPGPDAPRGSDLWQPGKLERLAAEAGLATESAFDVSWAYEFSDEQDLTDALLSVGGISVMIGAEPEPEARAAVVEALAQYASRTVATGSRTSGTAWSRARPRVGRAAIGPVTPRRRRTHRA